MNATDDDGGTALIAKGADVGAKRTDGRTALSVAADDNTKALLIQAGARL